MSDIVPLSPVLAGQMPGGPRADPPRTLAGALATAVPVVVLLLVATAPTAVLAALFVACTVAVVAVGVAAARRLSGRSVRLCLPRTRVCIRL